MRPKFNSLPFICILPLFIILMGMTTHGYTRSGNSGSTEAQNRWLILLYDDGDFNNGYDPLFDFATEAYAHENVDILVLEDNFWSPAVIWQIGANHEMIPQKYLGEVNMADSATLEYFLKFASSRFPGRRTILCFYDHGGGCWGACIDDTNYKKNPTASSILTPAAIRDALEKTKAVDLVCFTAPCLMGSIEVAYELRHNTSAYIGSENLSGYCWWFRTIGFICDTLKSRPDIGNHELAEAIVKSTAANGVHNYPDWFGSYTMAAVRSDRLDEAVGAIRALSKAALANHAEVFPLLNQALGNIQFYSSRYADVIDLFEEAMKLSRNPSLREAFQLAINSVRQAVLAEAHGPDLPGSNGLNIYFPPPPNIAFSSSYGLYNLAFAHDSGWFELLKTYTASWPLSVAPATKFSIPPTNGLDPFLSGVEISFPFREMGLKKRDGVER